MKRSSARSRLRIVLTAIFAVGFVWSLFMTFSSFAAANLFKIQDAKLSDLSADVSGAISSFDESTIVSNVTFHKLNDSAKYTITLKNTDSKDHIIESISDDNENAHISYLYDSYANTLVKAGDSFDFVATAKYTNAVTDMNARAQATNVKFMIKYLDIAEPEAISVNPSTGDEIAKNVIVLAISATGLIICIAIALKRNKKLNKIAAIAIAAVAATTIATSVKAATVEVNSFTLTTNYGFYDKVVIIYTNKNGDEQELISNYNEPANIPDQSKDGYTLTGWEDEQGNPVDPTQPITEDIKIRPVYRAHTYTIRFNGNGATSGEMADLAMTFDEAKTLPANAFNFSGRTYTGWDTEVNGSGAHYGDQAEVKNLTAEDGVIVTLYAQWSINPFHIDYDGNGATSGEMAQTNCEYDQSCILRDNAFSKPGYHFAGWKYNNNDYANKADVKNIIESGTITMVAQWAVNHYTIVFNVNTDDASATGNMADMTNLEYDHDYTLTANAFTRTGYNFGGWNTEIDGRNFGLTDEQEFHNLTTTNNAVITLYAQWDPIHYTIAFHQNSDGVTGNMSSQVFTYDEAKNLTQNAFIKNHYKFMGWTTAANGTGTKYDDRASIFNLTTEDGATIDLYAQWKERTAYLKGTVNNSWGSAGDMIRGLPGYANATAFRHYEGEPNFDEIETKNNMALNMSNFPVYTWIDGETIYWWSEAETIYAHEDSRNFFSGLKKAETIDYSGFNFSLTKNLAGFFRNTAALSTIDLSPLAAANPTTLEEMFYGSGIASVDLSPLKTTQTTNMKGMFNSTTALETVNLSAINTANVTDMSYLFSNSTNLKSVDFSHNNLSSVEDMNHMFYSDKKLESLNFTGVNTPNLKKMSWMFGGAKIASLDLSDLDTGNVTHFDELFYYADVANLDISGFDTHNATTFGSMFTAFNAHGQVLDLSHFDTTSLNGSMYEMFLATNASVIDLSSFDISAERAANIGMANILHISNSVETIYATEKLHFHDYSSVPDANLGVPADYGAQSKLVGGAGSTLRQLTMLGLSEYDKARIDDPCNGKPGMFAVKNAQYICFNANYDGADPATAGQYVSTTETDHLMANPFTRPGYRLVGWAESADGEKVYDNEGEITITTSEKSPKQLYAVWAEITAMLNTGVSVRAALLDIAGEATSFEHYPNGIPNLDEIENKREIQANNSEAKVYAWNDAEAGKIYWYSDAKTPKFNPASYRMFEGLSSLTKIDLTGLDASTATNLSRLFYGDTALTSTNIAALDTSNVTDMSHMFRNTGFTELNLEGLETGNVTNMTYMFAGTTNLNSINLSPLNTARVENMSYLLSGSGVSSVNLTSLDTSNLTNMADMFNGTTNLETVDLSPLNVQKVTTMAGLFEKSGISSINLAPLATESVTNLSRMFNQAPNLTTLDVSPLITKNVTDMSDMFLGVKLGEIDVSTFDTSKVENFARIFGSMGTVTIYASDSFVVDEGSDNVGNALMHDIIQGGAGSRFNIGNCTTECYAAMKIDDPDNNGYGSAFTYKNARYIRYHDNDGDDTNDETNYTLMPSHYITTAVENPYNLATKLTKNNFTRSGFVFTGWATSADGNVVYADEAEITTEASKTPLELYAIWIKATSVLQTGSNVNEILKSINPNVVSFVRYNGIPDFDAIDDERVISLSNAVVPTYAWSDGDTIYWWSEAETVYLNENSGSFFKNLSKLTTIEQTTLDTSKVKNMDYMFQYSGLVDFTFEMDTSNVTSMDAIFANCSKLERLDLSHVDTSKVTNMHGLVADAQKLTYLNLDNFSTASATNLESMFSTVKLMTTLDLTSFDTRKVTNMGWMISYITNLQTIYATDLFVPANNISMPNTLVGGAGSRNLGTSSVYARIDDPDNGNPGYFTMKGARYIRYNDNDGDTTNDETNYALMKSEYLKAGDSLKKNAFVRDGYVFTGWKDADNNDYTDEQVMADLTESKTPLELYAQWDAAPYTVTFNANGGEVLQSAKTVTYLQPYGELPTPVRYDYTNGMLGSKYGFKEWNTKADGNGDTITSSSIYENTDDTTLYAIWNDRFTVTIYNGESETPTIASYGIGDIIYLNAQNVTGKQFLYWEVDGIKKSYIDNCSMYMYQGKDLTIRAIYGSESDLESQQPGTYISDIYRQYNSNKIIVRSYSYVPDGYKIVRAGVIATLDANIANGTFDDQTATYVRPYEDNDNINDHSYYFTWSKSSVTSEQTVYVKAYLKYKDADGVEHTIYGDSVTATLTE